MNISEYRRKNHPENYRRSWPFTITSLILFLLVVTGMIQAWRHLAHDSYLICTVILPSGIMALIFLLAALNGRKDTIKEIISAILQLMYFWP